jgi:hypothetical protein
MNEQKAAKPILAAENPGRSAGTTQEPLAPEISMHTDTQVRKAGGRLSREDQRRLGDILQRVYDDVVRQGVPDRFKTLLNELGQSQNQSDQEKGAPRDDEVARGPSEGSGRVMTARGGDHPNKGSH